MNAVIQSHDSQSPSWRWQDIDFSHIRRERICNDDLMFYLLTAASFIEITADLYTSNLVEHYGRDSAASAWLSRQWEQEEVQHGHALRAYVRHVWPDFDWEAAYREFFAEYSTVCTPEELEPGKAREMLARCVVETGTSTFYGMLNAYADEPVLKQLTRLIQRDEVSHYRAFRDFYARYNADDKLGRLQLIWTLFKRLREVRNEDSFIAFKHVYLARHPGQTFDPAVFDHYQRRARHDLFGPHYPYRMAVRMVLSLLEPGRRSRAVLEPVLVAAARKALLH